MCSLRGVASPSWVGSFVDDGFTWLVSPMMFQPSTLVLSAASDADLQEKMRILNAYYLPGVDRSALYESITPVNTFRLIFNLYFGSDLDRLEDISYAHDMNPRYRFFDVTDIVDFE